MKKNYIKKLCEKSLENKLCEILHTLEKDHLCLNKKSINQTFNFISSKIV